MAFGAGSDVAWVLDISMAKKLKARVSSRRLVAAKLATEFCIRNFTKNGRARFFETADFEWASGLEQGYRLILDELRPILHQYATIPRFEQVSPEQAAVADEHDWKTWFLLAYGHQVPENIQRCPNTWRLLSSIPGLETAFFSILGPGKHIAPHRGPYAGVLRCHLGLLIPSTDPECVGIRVADQVRGWRVGSALIFDDAFEHEAWNRSDQLRVVLFLDVQRTLPALLAKINVRIIRAFAATRFIQGLVERARNHARAALGSERAA